MSMGASGVQGTEHSASSTSQPELDGLCELWEETHRALLCLEATAPHFSPPISPALSTKQLTIKLGGTWGMVLSRTALWSGFLAMAAEGRERFRTKLELGAGMEKMVMV